MPPSEGNNNDRGGVTICGAASVGMSRGDKVAIAAVLVCAVVRAGSVKVLPRANFNKKCLGTVSSRLGP